MRRFFENKHSIIIRSSIKNVVPEIVSWGEASWWPKNSLMRFARKDFGISVQVGSCYKQKVLLPFAPSWNVEVTDMTDKSITRAFLNGMFEGSETVSVKDINSYTIEVNYVMSYKVRGFLNQALWNLIFEKLHNKNIEEILESLKKYLEDRNYSAS